MKVLDFVCDFFADPKLLELSSKELVVRLLESLSKSGGVSAFLVKKDKKKQKLEFSSSPFVDRDLELFSHFLEQEYKENVVIQWGGDVIFIFPITIEKELNFILVKVSQKDLHDVLDLMWVFESFVQLFATWLQGSSDFKLRKFLRMICDIFDYSFSLESNIDGVISFLSELVLCDFAFVVEYQPALGVSKVLGSKVREDIILSEDFVSSQLKKVNSLVEVSFSLVGDSIEVFMEGSQITVLKKVRNTNNFVVVGFLSKSLYSNFEVIMKIFEALLYSFFFKFERIFTLDQIMDTAPVGIIISNPDGIILKVNKAAAQMFGYEKEEMVGKYFLNITSYGDIERSALKLREFLEKNLDSYSIRKKYIRKDGTEFEAIANVYAIKRRGRIEYGLVVIRNWETESRLEEKVKNLQKKFDILFKNVSVPIAILGRDGVIYEANEKFLSILGKGKEEVLYHSFFNFVRESKNFREVFLKYVNSSSENFGASANIETSRDVLLCDISMVKTDDVVFVMLLFKGRKSDFVRSLEVRIDRLLDGIAKPYDRVSYLEVEDKYKDFLSRYVDYILFLMPFDVIALLDREFVIRGIKVFESVFKKRFDGYLGEVSYYVIPIFNVEVFSESFSLENVEKIALNKKIYEFFTDSFAQFLKDFLLGLEYQGIKEMTIKDERTGEDQVFEIRALKAEDLYFLTVRDITSQKKYEDLILKERELFLKEIIERRRFWAVVSHEMRTPLNSIIGFSNLLLETKLDDDQRKYLDLIKFSSEVLLSLINDVLEYSKLEENEVKLENVEFNLYEEFLNSISMLEPKALNKGIKIDYYFDFNIPSLLVGDCYKLRRVIMNLLDNAIKFSYEGSNVFVEASFCSLRNENECIITFSVVDYGIGIPKDKLNSIFRPFVQVDMGFSRRHEGFGLGLSICKKIVDLMGGEIKVESEVGKGTKFTFSIPFNIKDVTPLIEKLRDILSSVRDVILIVDDSLPTSYFDLLQFLGLEVIVVLSLNELIEIVEKKRDKKLFLLMDYSSSKVCSVEELEKVVRDNENFRVIVFGLNKLSIRLDFDKGRFFVMEYPMNVFELLRVVRGDIEEISKLGYTYEDVKGILDVRKRVLVVEDNPVNLLLMLEILKKFSISPDVAHSGKECLEMVEIKDYDLIFMDIQMPDMDGYKLTSVIRSKSLKKQPIIVGVSAHVYKEDIEEAIRLGMNDYITKPLKIGDIAKVLAKYLLLEPQNISHEEGSSLDTEKLIDELTIKKFLDLVGKDRFSSFARELIESYVKTFSSEYSRLIKCSLEGDVVEISKIAHKLKGASYEIGFVKLGDVFSSIEVSAKKGENIITKELLENIKVLFDRSVAKFEKYVSS